MFQVPFHVYTLSGQELTSEADASVSLYDLCRDLLTKFPVPNDDFDVYEWRLVSGSTPLHGSELVGNVELPECATVQAIFHLSSTKFQSA